MYDAVNEKEVNPGDSKALVEKGESHPVVGYIRELLGDRQGRTIFYCSLIMLSIFPIFVDALDVFNRDGPGKYTGNEFCNGQTECSIAVGGMLILKLVEQ